MSASESSITEIGHQFGDHPLAGFERIADNQKVRTAEQSARRRHTGWVIGAALVARLCVIWYVLRDMPRGWLWTRGTEMTWMAAAVVHGRGLSDPYGVPTGPTASVAPGYPLLLAGVFRVFGVETVASAAVVLLVQVGINLLTVWAMLGIGRRFAGERAAVAMALLWGCSLATIWMPVILWETSFSALFLLLAVACALRLERAAQGLWLAWGAGCAVAGLMNPSLLPSLGALGAVAVWRGRRWREALLACVVFAGIYAPWPVRNARVFHATILTRCVAGFNLWVGNREGADGYLNESAFPTFNASELAVYRAVGEVRYDADKTRLAWAAIASEPVRFAWLTAIRARRFWSGTGSRGGSVFFALHGVLTTLLGGLGLWVLMKARRREAAYCFAVVLIFPLPYLITHAEFRYRLVLDPVLCVLGAVALEWIDSRRLDASAAVS